MSLAGTRGIVRVWQNGNSVTRAAVVEQCEGRILRPGNKNAMAQIYRCVAEASFDALVWRTLETKAKFIARVMSGDMTFRPSEDLDSAALTDAEVKATAIGQCARD
jgi:hypothetical protein